MWQNEENKILNYKAFWNWFLKHERAFYQTVILRENVETDFFAQLYPQLEKIVEGISYLTGRYDDETVELIFTADAYVRNIVFIEELVAAAPKIKGWLFTALKPAHHFDQLKIEIQGYEFSTNKLSFYASGSEEMPDLIDIKIVHPDYKPENAELIANGCIIFIDNLLGERESIEKLDYIDVVGPVVDESIELIPIEKLKDYLIWREKEFVDKYEEVEYNPGNSDFVVMQGENVETGNIALAIIDQYLLSWEGKASHPWIAVMILKYEDSDHDGLPGEQTIEILQGIEEDINKELSAQDGYLFIGIQTSSNQRETFYACMDYRKPSKVMHALKYKYCDKIELDFEMFKDKYWQTFERFRAVE